MVRHLQRSAAGKNRSSRSADWAAFTLVELLVVIGIIAILIAMLLPALNKAREAAKVTVCASNQHQIYVAMVMYANDNHGFLPGTNIVNNVKGAEYSAWLGAYPWDTRGYYEDRWYGVGMLVGGKYLPPSRVVECPDFITQGWTNFSANGGFTLPAKYAASGGLPSFGGQGSYVLNTIPYYAKESGAHGKLGRKGRDGGWNYPGPRVAHITAYIMCLASTGRVGDDIYPTITHNRKGLNCTYIDGHTVYLPISTRTWNSLAYGDGMLSSGTDLTGNRGLWPWASQEFQ